jgi:hypothetical protein
MSDEAGIKIDNINDIIDMIPKKGGRKRSKKGGVKTCQYCRQPLEKTELYTPTQKELNEEIHAHCLVKAQNRERGKRNKDRRRKKERAKSKKERDKRGKSPFQDLRIKKPVGANGEVRELTAQEKALNAANDRYEQEWFNGTLTPTAIVKGVIELGGLYNTMVKQARDYLKAKKDDEEREEEEEKNYASELVAYRCNLLIYYLLESAFVALGMGIGYYSYEHAVWTSFCIAEWIEATFPSYMRKKIQLEGQRQEADLKTQLFRDERDRLRKIKRDLRRGYNMRNNELPESEEPEILQLPDRDGNQAAIDEWKEKMGGQNPEGPSRVNKFFGNVMDSVTGFVDQAEDGFYTTADFFADRVEGSRRALGDGVRLGFKPVTTLTGATGAQAEALNAVYPVFYVMGITLLYFYLFKNMFRHVNRKPEKPKKHGGRKKTRKKRRKTRRKSKRRKRKRKRKTKRRKRRR